MYDFFPKCKKKCIFAAQKITIQKSSIYHEETKYHYYVRCHIGTYFLQFALRRRQRHRHIGRQRQRSRSRSFNHYTLQLVSQHWHGQSRQPHRPHRRPQSCHCLHQFPQQPGRCPLQKGFCRRYGGLGRRPHH